MQIHSQAPDAGTRCKHFVKKQHLECESHKQEANVDNEAKDLHPRLAVVPGHEVQIPYDVTNRKSEHVLVQVARIWEILRIVS